MLGFVVRDCDAGPARVANHGRSRVRGMRAPGSAGQTACKADATRAARTRTIRGWQRLAIMLCFMAATCLPTYADTTADTTPLHTVTLTAIRDATLIEDPAGALANGMGPALFAGRNAAGANSIRRGLVYFPVAEQLPPMARIERVFLTLHLTPSNEVPVQVAVHRVLDEWGEGNSFSAGGGGAPAQPGDSTWLHTFYDYQLWIIAGGQFVANASSTTLVAETDFYTWQSTPQLVADVRLWLRAPARNFGWIIIGDETAAQTAKRFDSRESATAAFRPMLTVEYRLPGPAPDVPGPGAQ
jgi:hypothetical protein